MWGKTTTVALYLGLASLGANTQELVYEPVNPSFGGDSFNSSHLLAIANSQNDYDDPDRANAGSTQSEQFLRQLQSRLLSSLAGQVNEAIFGENPQDQGTVVFGDQVIEFYRGLDSVVLTITDNATGSVTEIEIPLMLSGGGDAAIGQALNGALAQSGLGLNDNTDPLSDDFIDLQLGESAGIN